MIGKVKTMFRIQTEDPGSMAMRLGKVSDEKGEWFNTPCKDIANLSGRNPWKPLRRGFSVLDAAMTLGTGVYRVPLMGDEGKPTSLLSQSMLMKIFNSDAKNRLGKMKQMTAEELGGRKDLVTVSVDALTVSVWAAAESATRGAHWLTF